MLFWASNCSTSSSSFSTSSDGTRFRGKALRSRKGRGKTKPCGPRCLLHLHILDKVFPCLLPFNLRNCTDRLKDRHEMTCMNKSCWNFQPQRQRLSTNRNKYCILHSELSSNEEKIMQDFEVSQAPAKTLPVWPSLLGLRPPQPWQLRARSGGVCYVQFISLQL